MFTYKIGISEQEHDAFIASTLQANLLQSSSWAKIKDNWNNERIGFYQDGLLVASASILIRPLPLGFSMFYIPRGPVMDYQDKELVSFVLDSLKRYAKQKRALFIKFDPMLYLRQSHADNLSDTKDNPETLAAIDTLTACGAEWSGRTSDLAETIQPRFQTNIYAETFSLDNLSKKNRQALRTAQNKGVQVIFGGSELLEDFAALMKKTESRKHIHLRGLDYYQKLLATYPEHSYVTMAILDLSERQKTLEQQLHKALAEKETFSEQTRQTKVENNKKTIERLEKEIAFLKEQARLTGRDSLPLAATISLEFGDTSENIYAGMDETFRSYQPALLTWFETAKHAFERGSRWQNMGGIENNLDGGLFHFKSRFEPTIEEFVGEFNLPVNKPLYALSNLAYTLRKKMRSKH
ncbi:aminoacyltransferase [Streptococcus sp. zg-JUN1979]|uniref:aminoacyltransferase n=1 Tax=Streptococcus sp. zg-JUN1979 TaxID=3391450 RepID=UPI0039A59910